MVIESSGHVFADLGFEPGEAAILQMRAKLMSDLRERIMASGMTQTEAAQVLGVGQSRVSDLMRGKWEKFNLEMRITVDQMIRDRSFDTNNALRYYKCDDQELRR
jgi:predicted XRE-type DNA-binding protein